MAKAEKCCNVTMLSYLTLGLFLEYTKEKKQGEIESKESVEKKKSTMPWLDDLDI